MNICKLQKKKSNSIGPERKMLEWVFGGGSFCTLNHVVNAMLEKKLEQL
jgi:hypothetical protein